jgi:hypothetical protein
LHHLRGFLSGQEVGQIHLAAELYFAQGHLTDKWGQYFPASSVLFFIPLPSRECPQIYVGVGRSLDCHVRQSV